jgi:hypothetical protein
LNGKKKKKCCNDTLGTIVSFRIPADPSSLHVFIYNMLKTTLSEEVPNHRSEVCNFAETRF